MFVIRERLYAHPVELSAEQNVIAQNAF